MSDDGHGFDVRSCDAASDPQVHGVLKHRALTQEICRLAVDNGQADGIQEAPMEAAGQPVDLACHVELVQS